jgi:hypothetical protein
MKCPHCGEETQGGKSCEKCGKDLATRREVEVEYKDFKLSELLDIKMPGRTPSENEAGKPQADKGESGDTRRREKQRAKKGGSHLALVAALVLLAAACGFYLLKFLMKF